MTDNNTFYDDFDWDADTEEMEPREFRKAYEDSDSLLPQVGLEPEPIAEETSSRSRTTIPDKEFHSRWRIMFEHLLKFFSDAFGRHSRF